jgi:hypothetical protein
MVRPALLAAALFYLPTAGWVVRNYVRMGAPVLATNQGSSLYGNYNSVSARLEGPHFADWIHPSLIPGEPRMEQLATTMSEPEMSRYYTAKTIQFVRNHARVVPLVDSWTPGSRIASPAFGGPAPRLEMVTPRVDLPRGPLRNCRLAAID